MSSKKCVPFFLGHPVVFSSPNHGINTAFCSGLVNNFVLNKHHRHSRHQKACKITVMKYEVFFKSSMNKVRQLHYCLECGQLNLTSKWCWTDSSNESEPTRLWEADWKGCVRRVQIKTGIVMVSGVNPGGMGGGIYPPNISPGGMAYEIIPPNV